MTTHLSKIGFDLKTNKRFGVEERQINKVTLKNRKFEAHKSKTIVNSEIVTLSLQQ